MRLDLLPAVAASIFLTRLVKGPVTSRAKIIATGLLPFCQTRQFFLPAMAPLMFSGWNGWRILLPTWGPDLRASPATTPAAASAITAKAPTAKRFFIVEPSSEE